MKFNDSGAFRRLFESLGLPVTSAVPNCIDLVFADSLPATVMLHPNGREVAIDVWCFDAAPLAGQARSAVVKALLRLNQAASSCQPVRVALDSRDFVVLHGRRPLHQLDERAFGAWLTWHADQGRRVRTLARTLSLKRESQCAKGPFDRLSRTEPE